MVKKAESNGNLATLWMQTGRLLRDRMFQHHKSKNINPPQMFALHIIHEHAGITMKELADLLCITSPSATSIVNRLVKLKWVVRVADPKNRKLVRVKLASKGKNMLESAMQEQAKAMKGVLNLLSASDQHDFARILTNLHTALLNSKI